MTARSILSTDAYREHFLRSSDAILIIEGDRFVDCNPAAARMLRFASREELLRTVSSDATPRDGMPGHPGALSPPFQPDGRDSFSKAQEMMDLAFELGSHTFEWVHRRADGDPLMVEVQLTPVDQGPPEVICVTWRDIGERKRREAKKQQSQRLESVGRLAGGIAHDFNNLLTVILGCTELLEDTEPEDAVEARDLLGQIRETGEKAAALTQQLLTFSSGQPVGEKVVDVGQLVGELVPLLERLAGDHIEIVFSSPASVLCVLADPNQLEQIIVNLVTNARDAMADGGTLFIALTSATCSRSAPLQDLPPGEYAYLRVHDDGAGMDSETVEHAFEPFYTTKADRHGTGLGLATVYAVATHAGGSAWIQSREQAGTTVHVALPLTQDRPDSQSVEAAARRGHVQGETVLLVDDESEIRKLLERSLKKAGYRVIAAGDGQEALDRATAFDEPIDALVTDVAMPRLTGPELHQALLPQRPEIRALFMSGYVPAGSLFEGELGAPLLHKPFPPSDLLDRLRELLDAPSVAD